MKFGCFGTLKDFGALEEAGFESIELGLDELCAMPWDEFLAFSERVRGSRLGVHAVSRLIPPSECIWADSFDETYWLDFFKEGAKRTAALGTTLWPFGCGKARSMPQEAKEVPAASKRVNDFICKIASLLHNYGIQLVLEPLGPAYSNYLRTMGECAQLIERSGQENLRLMCDLRHMYDRGESVTEIGRFCSLVVHAHIDCPTSTQRLFPQPTDGFNYLPYLQELAHFDYHSILTVEADSYHDMVREGKASRCYLDQLWKAASLPNKI